MRMDFGDPMPYLPVNNKAVLLTWEVAMANYFVGTDVGTTGTKSCVMDEQGKVIGSHRI